MKSNEENDSEGRAVSLFAVDSDLAAGCKGYALGSGKSKTSPGELRRKERVEELRDSLGIDPTTVVGHLQIHAIAGTALIRRFRWDTAYLNFNSATLHSIERLHSVSEQDIK